jgi:hypothetical protein
MLEDGEMFEEEEFEEGSEEELAAAEREAAATGTQATKLDGTMPLTQDRTATPPPAR